MDDQTTQSLKNMEFYLKNIKGHEVQLKQIIETNERIARSLENLEKMMEESRDAYLSLIKIERRQKRQKAHE